MKFLHSADWQLGKSFRQFGDKAGELREVRLGTLRRALQLARDKKVDAFVVAGDLFEDNEIDDAVVSSAVSVFAGFADLPIFILPGNHDPFVGPGSVWNRPSFLSAPKNVRVFRHAEAVELNGGFIVASPLQQKNSPLDPSLKLAELTTKLSGQVGRRGLRMTSSSFESRPPPGRCSVHWNRGCLGPLLRFHATVRATSSLMSTCRFLVSV